MNARRSANYGLGAGSLVAGYRIEAEIGKGGMAAVFRAHDERLGRTVALKILAPELAADREFRKRFIRESRAAAATDHPHIVPVFEAGEADGVLFIAMRFVRGGDLGSKVGQFGPLAPAAAATIVSQASSALDAAHKHGVVHRDVKPANMLLDVGDTGRPDHMYLTDFGLSKDSLTASTLTKLTSAGQVLGTLDYMAPEQIGGTSVDGRADQYGLACAAFELLSGLPPFGESSSTALLRAHLSDSPPPLSSRRSGLPTAADEVFAKALAKDPADRYGTCATFAGALREVLGVEPYRSGPYGAAVPDRPVPKPAPPPPRPAPVMPRGGVGHPSTSPTVVRKYDAADNAPPAHQDRAEVEPIDPAQAATGEHAQAGDGRHWPAWRGRRGPGGAGSGPNR